MVYGIYNYIVTGAYKPTYILGASHCNDLKNMMQPKNVDPTNQTH